MLRSKISELINRLIRSRWALRAELEALLIAAYRAGAIRVVYDIGAHKGRWSLQMKKVMPNARFLLFEANPLHANDLATTGLEYEICALSRAGLAGGEFYSLRDDSGSTGGSFYKEKTPQYLPVSKEWLPTTTLTNVAAKKHLPMPDFVKIDTQGSELDILRGGAEVVSNAGYLLLEVPFLEYNQGAPKIGEYLSAVEDLDFYPVCLAEQHHYEGVLIQADFLFVSKSRLSQGILEKFITTS